MLSRGVEGHGFKRVSSGLARRALMAKKVKHEPRTRMRNKIPQDASVCVVAVLHNFTADDVEDTNLSESPPRREDNFIRQYSTSPGQNRFPMKPLTSSALKVCV
jgi:hypothetical protein